MDVCAGAASALARFVCGVRPRSGPGVGLYANDRSVFVVFKAGRAYDMCVCWTRNSKALWGRGRPGKLLYTLSSFLIVTLY